jgi:hypothetical protein
VTWRAWPEIPALPLVFISYRDRGGNQLFFNSQLDLYRQSHPTKNNLYSVLSKQISERFPRFLSQLRQP